MRSISTSCTVLGLLFLALLAGCSRSANPVTPDTSIRGAEGFFGCLPVFDGSEYPYRDLDIATLIKKGDGIFDCLLQKGTVTY